MSEAKPTIQETTEVKPEVKPGVEPTVKQTVQDPQVKQTVEDPQVKPKVKQTVKPTVEIDYDAMYKFSPSEEELLDKDSDEDSFWEINDRLDNATEKLKVIEEIYEELPEEARKVIKEGIERSQGHYESIKTYERYCFGYFKHFNEHEFAGYVANVYSYKEISLCLIHLVQRMCEIIQTRCPLNPSKKYLEFLQKLEIEEVKQTERKRTKKLLTYGSPADLFDELKNQLNEVKSYGAQLRLFFGMYNEVKFTEWYDEVEGTTWQKKFEEERTNFDTLLKEMKKVHKEAEEEYTNVIMFLECVSRTLKDYCNGKIISALLAKSKVQESIGKMRDIYYDCRITRAPEVEKHETKGDFKITWYKGAEEIAIEEDVVSEIYQPHTDSFEQEEEYEYEDIENMLEEDV